MVHDERRGICRLMSNKAVCALLDVSVKWKMFSHGGFRESFVTVAAEVDVDLFLLEITESLIFKLITILL